MSKHKELPNELQLEAFTYGQDGKRIEIKLHPRILDDILRKPRQIGQWSLDFSTKILRDVKHAEKWKCEFYGEVPRL